MGQSVWVWLSSIEGCNLHICYPDWKRRLRMGQAAGGGASSPSHQNGQAALWALQLGKLLRHSLSTRNMTCGSHEVGGKLRGREGRRGGGGKERESSCHAFLSSVFNTKSIHRTSLITLPHFLCLLFFSPSLNFDSISEKHSDPFTFCTLKRVSGWL